MRNNFFCLLKEKELKLKLMLPPGFKSPGVILYK